MDSPLAIGEVWVKSQFPAVCAYHPDAYVLCGIGDNDEPVEGTIKVIFGDGKSNNHARHYVARIDRKKKEAHYHLKLDMNILPKYKFAFIKKIIIQRIRNC